jgi:pilus assembly protein TadC
MTAGIVLGVFILLVLGVFILLVSIVFFIVACVFFNDGDTSWGIGFILIGLFFFTGGVFNIAIVPIEYYEKRIPTLREQVLSYEKDQIEMELKGLEEK